MASLTLTALVCLILILTSESLGNDVLDALKEMPEWEHILGFKKRTEDKLDSLSRRKHGSAFVFQVEHSGITEIVRAPSIVKYDNIQVNKGFGYNSETGHFTCQKNGLYFFGYSILSTRGTKTYVTLMRNGTPTSRIYTHMTSANIQDTMKNIILYLHKGDLLWVEVTEGSIWSKGGSNTFQGFQLPD